MRHKKFSKLYFIRVIKRLYILILSAFFCVSVKSQPISAEEAYLNVMDFLLQNDGMMSKSRVNTIKPTLSYSSGSIYAFNLSESFVLASADRSMPAILGYSDGGSFENAFRSPCFRAFIRQYEQQYRPEFRIFKPSNVANVIEPLCKDTWHQYAPYNNMCPLEEDTENRCLVGCVAVPMAEIMNYYKYPLQGHGYLEYNDSDGCGKILSTDLSDHTYDWSNIKDDYSGSYSDSEASAIAQLMYDCGVSVDMRYTSEASGAVSAKQPRSLVNNFGFDEGMQMYYRNFYNQVEWDSIMFNELNERRPMIISGYNASGGHSFLCDGYDSNGFFHIRMGWPDEEANGYYYFTWLTPDLPEWHDVNNPEGGFNILQSILVGIKPKGQQQVSQQRYMFGFSYINTLSGEKVVTTRNQTIDICVYSLANCGWNKHNGVVGIALKNIGEGRISAIHNSRLLYTYDREFSLEEFTDSVYDDTISICIGQDVVDGKYKIVPVYEENGKYVEARTMVGQPNYLVCEVNKNSVSIYEPDNESSNLVISDVDFPSLIYQNTTPPHGFTVTNYGAEYSGRLYIGLYHEVAPTKNLIFCMTGISIGSGESQRFDFKQSYIGIAPGTLYHLRIISDVSLLNDSSIVVYDNTEDYIEIRKQETGIKEIDSDHIVGNTRYYDLTGRRILEPSSLHKGTIYIEALPTGETRKRILL